MIFFKKKINFQNLSLISSSLVCLFLASFYVISLYFWSRENRYKRNEPGVIKRRFISVTLSSVLSLIVIYVLSTNGYNSHSHTIDEWTGLRFDFVNLLFSTIISFSLTAILFAGPIFQNFLIEYYDYLDDLYFEKSKKQDERYNSKPEKIDEFNSLKNFISFVKKLFISLINNLKLNIILRKFFDLHFLRNYVISTLTEEFVFRSCMLPLLIGHMTWLESIFLTPLFFGTAHLHHIYEGYKSKEKDLKILLIGHLFQFAYTYCFGVYSSYLFVRTGSFFASFLAHSFCNMMGFPDFDGLINEFNGRTRVFLIIMYFFGLISFICLLSPLTNPIFFDNFVYSKYF